LKCKRLYFQNFIAKYFSFAILLLPFSQISSFLGTILTSLADPHAFLSATSTTSLKGLRRRYQKGVGRIRAVRLSFPQITPTKSGYLAIVAIEDFRLKWRSTVGASGAYQPSAGLIRWRTSPHFSSRAVPAFWRPLHVGPVRSRLNIPRAQPTGGTFLRSFWFSVVCS